MPPLSPASISLPERYRVLRHIANGGMASVWEAKDELLARPVAVKLLAEHLTADDAARGRFEREARAAAGLSNHPNVVTIYDFGEYEGKAFLVMELMRGGSIADLLRDGVRLRRENVVRWLTEAASALDAAHEAGVVHRDIKPGNMLLDERGRLALGDFGIARLAAEDQQFTQTGMILGTAAYVSPEQALGERAGAASDRYSLGVVAFELLTRSKPFQAEHYAAQARAHIEDPPPSASAREDSLPPAVDGVLARALSKAPEARFPTAGAFVDALVRALDDRGAPPPTDVTRPLPRTAYAAAAPAAAPAHASEREPRRLSGDGTSPPRRRRLPMEPPPDPRRGSKLPFILAAVLGALVLGGVAFAALAGGGGGGGSEEPARNEPRAEQTATATPTSTPEATATATPTEAEATPEPTPEPTPEAPTPTPTPEAENEGGGGGGGGGGGASPARRDEAAASRFNDQGFSQLQAGDAGTAARTLKKAYDRCGGSEALDPCGYALFNYGRALRLSGKPDRAVPILEERVKRFPDDQRPVVDRELELARGGVKD